MEALVHAIAGIRARHEAASSRQSQAFRAIMLLGIARDEMTHDRRNQDPIAGYGFVRRTAARAAREPREKRGLANLDLSLWLPKFDDPRESK
jgi:hypothetical protein